MTSSIIWLLLTVLISVNVLLFLFVLIKKMIMNRVNHLKEPVRREYEEAFVRFIAGQDDSLSINPQTIVEKKVFRSLLLQYNMYIEQNRLKKVLELEEGQAIEKDVEKLIKSRNVWNRKIGIYLAGEYKLTSLTPVIRKQLNKSDHDLLFITSKALISLADDTYLKDILNAVTSKDELTRNQILSLLEGVRGDIRGILEEVFETGDEGLKAIAVEEAGKRQYSESVDWITELIQSGDKELRIAALKASYSIGHIENEAFLKAVFSAVRDEYWEVRAFLARFLRKVVSEEAVDVLVDFMQDSSWHVRRNAAESLLHHDELGRTALIRLLDSEDTFARETARAVLDKDALSRSF